MVVNAVHPAVASAMNVLLTGAGVDAHNIDEIVYVSVQVAVSGKKSKHPFTSSTLSTTTVAPTTTSRPTATATSMMTR